MILLTEDFYRDLAKNTPLNESLRRLFSALTETSDFVLLKDQLEQVRIEFTKMQSDVVERVKNGDLRHLPLCLIVDKSSTSGGTFLRWRSSSRKFKTSGNILISQIVADENIEQELRQQLLEAEKERLLVNMQATIFNFVLRQLRENIEKIESAEQILAV